MFTQIPESVATALSVLKKGGYGGWLVGGCVRDTLMGKTPHDYDITTPALPQELLALFADYKCIEAGLKHGTVTPVIHGVPVEITTFRIDGTYRDHRRPDSVAFTDQLALDLSRRDFTVNAMAYSLEDGLADLYGGRADLTNRIIRCVGEPDRRFNEDGLRILRALRFASVLNFTIEPATGESVLKNAPLLRAVSAERIYAEFRRLICGKGAGRILDAYGPVLCVFIPAMEASVADSENRRRICNAIDAAPENESVRMAILMQHLGRTGADNAMRGMKTETAARKLVSALVGLQDSPVLDDPDMTAVRRLIRQVGLEAVSLLTAAELAKAEAAGQSRRKQSAEAVRCLSMEIQRSGICCTLKDLAVSGRDLIAAGAPAGTGLGDLLDALLDAVIEGETENTKEALLKKAGL